MGRARVVGVGDAVPTVVTTNDQLESSLGLPAGWIEQRTGVRERRIASADISTGDLAVQAGASALRDAGIDPGAIGLVLLATSTPDHILPPTAPWVAHTLGMRGAGAIDITGACAGFVYALSLGSSYVSVTNQMVLVIGANVLSRRVNPADSDTAVVFADGAGAVVLAPTADRDQGILTCVLASDGAKPEALYIPAGGSKIPLTPKMVQDGHHRIQMQDGSEVFRQAVRGMVRSGSAAMTQAEVSASELQWWVPHQANRRIIDEVGRQLGISSDQTVVTIDRYGNSSAATIPMALAAHRTAGLINDGDLVLLTAAGAGFLSGAAVLRW